MKAPALVVALAVSGLLTLPASAEIAGWRMDGDGRYLDASPPTTWSSDDNVAWKARMPSWSNASPIHLAEAGLIVVLSEPGDIVAVRADSGEIAWQVTADDTAQRPEAHQANGWTSATPVSDGERVYAVFGTGVVAAYTAGGEKVWSRLVQAPEHRWGHSASPVLAGGRLVVHAVDLFGLDPATGEEVWRTASEPSWGSPAATRIGGTDVLIMPSGDVFRADDGSRVASEIGTLQFSVPVVHDGIVYFIEKKATAVRLPTTLDGTFETLWTSRVEGSRHYASSLVHDGLVYAISREQDFSILDAKTGEVLDARRFDLYDGGSNGAYTSITLAGDKLFLSTENGVTLVFEPGKTYSEVARNQIEGLRSTPIFLGDRMIVRGFDYLYAFGTPANSGG